MSQTLTPPLYDSLADSYESVASQALYRWCAERIIEQWPARGVQDALDLGCGSGLSTEAFVKALPQVRWYGLDPSIAMLARAQRKPSLASVAWHTGNAEALPFETQSLDAIACNVAFHWFGEGAPAEMARVLRPGGGLRMVVPLLRPSKMLDGNQALRRAFVRLRPRHHGTHTAGYDIEGLTRRFSGWSSLSFSPLIYEETFEHPAHLAAALSARGSLTAIFGSRAAQAKAYLEGLEAREMRFAWCFTLLSAQAPS